MRARGLEEPHRLARKKAYAMVSEESLATPQPQAITPTSTHKYPSRTRVTPLGSHVSGAFMRGLACNSHMHSSSLSAHNSGLQRTSCIPLALRTRDSLQLPPHRVSPARLRGHVVWSAAVSRPSGGTLTEHGEAHDTTAKVSQPDHASDGRCVASSVLGVRHCLKPAHRTSHRSRPSEQVFA